MPYARISGDSGTSTPADSQCALLNDWSHPAAISRRRGAPRRSLAFAPHRAAPLHIAFSQGRRFACRIQLYQHDRNQLFVTAIRQPISAVRVPYGHLRADAPGAPLHNDPTAPRSPTGNARSPRPAAAGGYARISATRLASSTSSNNSR